jgi:hypothetical protein
MAKPGRKDKLTAQVQDRICNAIRAGNYYEAACKYAGISRQTFWNWLERGGKARSGKFKDFYEAVKQAEAEAEVRIVAQWQKSIPESWQAARDFLARRFPERWGPKEKHELTGKDGGAIKQEVKHELSAETAETIFDILEKAGAFDTALDDAEDDEVYTSYPDGETECVSITPLP